MRTIAAFPYLRLSQPIVGSLFQPMVEVVVSFDTTALRHAFFLDSGADVSLIPASLGHALGLRRNQDQATSVRGLSTERADLNLVEVHLQIGQTHEFPVRVGWLTDDNVPPLLGRLDVFDRLTFELNHERRMVIVKQ